LTGELAATTKRLGELEKKCSEEFDCKVEELPAFIKQLEEEAEKSLKNAEGVLGMTENEPVPQKDEPEESAIEDDEDDEEELDDDGMF
jgi:hypothetical protein